jgi:outer membrane lipoprotein-sorting protein
MKTTIKTLALVLLVGLFSSSCAAVSRLNTEYEEELARFEQMSPEEKAEFEQAQHEKEKINWNEYIGGGDD